MFRIAIRIVVALCIVLVASVGTIDILSRIVNAEGRANDDLAAISVAASSRTSGPVLAKQTVRPLIPDRLIIPSIALDAHVQHVNVTGAGNMAVPSNFTDVGWYESGPKPGAAGSAVFAGHLDNALGTSAVFVNLETLREGDLVYVTDTAANRLAYKVTKKERYPYTATPGEDIFATSGPSRLVLITCDGVWDQAAHSYTERLVVFAEPI